ncbi:MAG: DUF6077 domain-containing protein [Planctomycetota bacterium]|jgi:hypothetical protein
MVAVKISASGILEALLRLMVVIFAAWTVSYQIVLAARLAAYSAAVIFVPVAALFLFLSLRRGGRRAVTGPARTGDPVGVLIGVLILAALCAALSLVINRPDADDVGFYHRALVQNERLDEPFLTGDTVHNVDGLPGLTTVHLMASYEIGTAFLARFTGLDALWLYQNGNCALAAFALPVIYYLLFRAFGLTPLSSLLASAGSVAFLWFDGNNHASIGNYAFVRLWQGKCILLTVLVPLVVLLFMRFWEKPNLRNWAVLFSAGVAAVGLSGTGLVVMPLLVFVVSVSAAIHDIQYEISPPRWALTKVVFSNLASGYCVLLGLGLLVGVIPSLRDISHAEQVRWHAETWWVNLTYSLGTNWSVVWYCGLVVLGAAFAPVRRKPRIALVSAAVTTVLCFNPLVGPIWLKILFNVYWRLVFVLPIAFSAGLLAAGLPVLLRGRLVRPANLARLVAACLIVVVFAGHYRQATFYRSNAVTMKNPAEYRFDADALEFSKLAAPLLDGRNLLAPVAIVNAIPLLNPSVRLETHRPWITRTLLMEMRKGQEARRRMRAQVFVTRPSGRPFDRKSFGESISRGVDSVVARGDRDEAVEAVLVSSEDTWRPALSAEGFTLFLKE